MKNIKSLIWGALLIALGSVFALNSLGVTDINLFFEGWWTLFIIIPAIGGIISDRDKTGAVIGLLVGVALLLSSRGIWDFSILLKLFFPAVLVIIGISIITKNFKKESENSTDGAHKSSFEQANGTSNRKEYAATFSGQDVSFDGELFEGADLSAAFGGIKLDLTKAIIEKDVTVNASAAFGGITVILPDGVNVIIKSSALFGGVSDAKKRIHIEGANTVYINADAAFGGVDVK